jgi:hypothetical protein
VRHRLRDHADPTSGARPNVDVGPRTRPSPEALAALSELKAKHYEAWLDVAVTALGGKTPREAVRKKKGREEVDVLLRMMENQEQRLDVAPFDFGPLRRELGLDVGEGSSQHKP